MCLCVCGVFTDILSLSLSLSLSPLSFLGIDGGISFLPSIYPSVHFLSRKKKKEEKKKKKKIHNGSGT